MSAKMHQKQLQSQRGPAHKGLLGLLGGALLLSVGCASLRDYRFSVGAAALATGAAVGYSGASPEEVPETQAALWGSIFATSALVLSEFFWSDSQSLKQAQIEKLELSRELNEALKPPRRQFQEVFR